MMSLHVKGELQKHLRYLRINQPLIARIPWKMEPGRKSVR